MKYGGRDPAGPRAPKSGGSADPVVPTPLPKQLDEVITIYLPLHTAFVLIGNIQPLGSIYNVAFPTFQEGGV